MKKICFIITDAISFNTLCKGQLEYFYNTQEFDATLVCGGDEKQIEKLKARKVGNVMKMPLTRQPNLLNDIKCLFMLWKFLLINRFDLIVYSTPKALLLGSLAGFLSFQPNRTALVRGRVYENYTGKKRKIFSFLDKISLSLSNYVLFISKSLKQVYLDEKIISSSKAIILNQGSSNGVDIHKFFPIESRVNQKFSIVMMGRICHDKGIFDLTKLIELIKDLPLELILVGKVEDEGSQFELDYILKNYDFVKYIPHTTEPVSYFQLADLHLFLSHREGFGNVALEAASCNVPTFAYDVTGVKDSVQDNISGLKFAFQDIESIAEAIRNAVENPQKFKSQFSNSRDWAIKNFEQKKVWNNYLNFYQKILDSKLTHD
ncbi:glycosyltransferase [Acinetobacter radioresistens]|uniref:glycosyltransferase n=1 Tax=Acinetobacter radioresistens TaxID=40216 RepID=UPI00125F5F67|nr:glycosyltransferase [Acinetobacter radioresistens]